MTATDTAALAANDDTNTKTIGEHLAAAQAQDTSANACVESYRDLWNGGEAARNAAKDIRAAWNLGQIADLGKATEEERRRFLSEIDDAWKKLGLRPAKVG